MGKSLDVGDPVPQSPDSDGKNNFSGAYDEETQNVDIARIEKVYR